MYALKDYDSTLQEYIKDRMKLLVDQAGEVCEDNPELAEFLLNEAEGLARAYDRGDNFIWVERIRYNR